MAKPGGCDEAECTQIVKSKIIMDRSSIGYKYIIILIPAYWS